MQSSQGDTLYPQQVSNYGSAASLLLSIPVSRGGARGMQRGEHQARFPSLWNPPGLSGITVYLCLFKPDAGKSGFVIFFFPSSAMNRLVFLNQKNAAFLFDVKDKERFPPS